MKRIFNNINLMQTPVILQLLTYLTMIKLFIRSPILFKVHKSNELYGCVQKFGDNLCLMLLCGV